jgi:hypothetical protein
LKIARCDTGQVESGGRGKNEKEEAREEHVRQDLAWFHHCSEAGREKAKGMLLRLDQIDQLMYMRLGVSERKSEQSKYFLYFLRKNCCATEISVPRSLHDESAISNKLSCLLSMDLVGFIFLLNTMFVIIF